VRGEVSGVVGARGPGRKQPLGMGGHVAAFRGIAVALLAQHLAVRSGKERAERMVALAAERRATSKAQRSKAS
jgi:hypothetical protein